MTLTFLFYRMTKLLDGEIEQDEVFWNQDALMEVIHVIFIFLGNLQNWLQVHIFFVNDVLDFSGCYLKNLLPFDQVWIVYKICILINILMRRCLLISDFMMYWLLS